MFDYSTIIFPQGILLSNHEYHKQFIQFPIFYLDKHSEYGSGIGQEVILEEDLIALDISIVLPRAIFENINASTLGLLFTYYRLPSFFPVQRRSNNDQIFVASPVVGASLAGIEKVSSLSQPVVLTLPVMVVSDIKYIGGVCQRVS